MPTRRRGRERALFPFPERSGKLIKSQTSLATIQIAVESYITVLIIPILADQWFIEFNT